jgi:hypothetical protein
MVLRMACPTRRTGSDNWYYRRTIPADVRRILERLPKERRPRGWYKTHISISLGTADRAAAKTKCPEIAAEVERQLKALREGGAHSQASLSAGRHRLPGLRARA